MTASIFPGTTGDSVRITYEGNTVMYFALDLVAQTFFFGGYSVLISMSTCMLLKRGLKSTVNKVMFGLTLFMYLLSAGYWAYSVAGVVNRFRNYIALAADSSLDQTVNDVLKWSPLFNALTMIIYVLSDGIVVWRAWVICFRRHRKYMCIPIGFLIVTALSSLLSIALRIANFGTAHKAYLHDAMNIAQLSTITASLISNLSSTAVVSATAWHHRRVLRAAFSESRRKTRSSKILLLIVESGVLFCLFSIIGLLASLIRLPQGTLGDLYAPLSIHIAGAYPPIVLLLVSTQRALTESTFATSAGSGSSSECSETPITFTVPDESTFDFDDAEAKRGARGRSDSEARLV
ncbi:hypothetical protein B0H15DRAFT_861942 [Mycena belliarum]|uniref:Uncharacterized protein n=1 Tax=Mycena belliarum TaxID=1033014 RepID=A0AAD6TRR6_9AGAR|nr:hypothetical protein B0H15DRAFT_861942 [Mycena belliae]